MAALGTTVETAAIAALETALNQALALDPATGRALAALEGKVFQLDCTQPELEIFLIAQAERIRLSGHWEGDITTGIRGSAGDFAELAASDDAAASLINGKLELHGNSGPLIELQGILAGLDMDWEAPLVEALGDVVGHQLAQGMRGLFSWGQQARSSLHRQIEEFIIEEARLTPPRLEVERFYSDIQSLNNQVDRLQARMQQLAQRLAANESS